MFVMGVLVQQTLLPIMEGYDETLHFGYVRYLRATGALPDRRQATTNITSQESSQPPLAYWVAASIMDLLGLPCDDAKTPSFLSLRNKWFSPPNEHRIRDNMNVYFHGPGEQLTTQAAPDTVSGDRWARLVSLLWGIIAVIAAYNAANEFFRERRWATVATALFALTPQMIQLSAYVSNDVTATALATLVTWQILVVVSARHTHIRLVVIGILLGLCGLAKVNTLLIAPAVGLALLLDGYNRRLALSTFITSGLLVALPCIAVVAPWLLYGIVNYGSALGLETHSVFENPNLAPQSLSQFLSALAPVYHSYWGRFGGGAVWLQPSVYILYDVLVVLALLGFALFIARHPRTSVLMKSRRGQQGIMLLTIALTFGLGLTLWLLRLFAIDFGIHGRLIYPAHAAVTILVTTGIYLLASRSPRYAFALRLFTVALPAVAGLIAAPLLLYSTFSGPTLLTRQQLPVLSGSPIDFDNTLRLLGYVPKSPYIQPLQELTLCWEVLKPASKEAVIAIKILESGHIVADRTSTVGLGHFPGALWKPGDIFCNDFDVALRDGLKQASRYEVVVTIPGWSASTLDGTPLDLPRVMTLFSPAGVMTTSIDWQDAIHPRIEFPGFAALDRVKVNGLLASGQRVILDLHWTVKQRTKSDWSQFVHLLGPEQFAIVLADSVPRRGQYPTFAWSPGEQIVDNWQLTIPPDLKPGLYSLETGLYSQASGERTPVLKDGQPVLTGSVQLLTFEVK
jgi:4-amino-4-deoxy-L-arabinose transferase-like glycosyltransferase